MSIIPAPASVQLGLNPIKFTVDAERTTSGTLANPGFLAKWRATGLRGDTLAQQQGVNMVDMVLNAQGKRTAPAVTGRIGFIQSIDNVTWLTIQSSTFSTVDFIRQTQAFSPTSIMDGGFTDGEDFVALAIWGDAAGGLVTIKNIRIQAYLILPPGAIMTRLI